MHKKFQKNIKNIIDTIRFYENKYPLVHYLKCYFNFKDKVCFIEGDLSGLLYFLRRLSELILSQTKSDHLHFYNDTDLESDGKNITIYKNENNRRLKLTCDYTDDDGLFIDGNEKGLFHIAEDVVQLILDKNKNLSKNFRFPRSFQNGNLTFTISKKESN